MIIKDLISIIEDFAPLSAQEKYDNAGLIVGDDNEEVDSALLCVDITEDVVDEAITKGCGVIIAHHPIIFSPIKTITNRSYIDRVLIKAIKNNIALYACHTNLDSIYGGMSWKLANELSLSNCTLLDGDLATMRGFGIVGELEKEIDVLEFLKIVKSKLNIGAIKYSDLCHTKVRKVALCTGSGGSLLDKAINSGAELYLSADFKYNSYLDAKSRIIIADIGHFESEYCVIDLLFDIIRKKISTFVVHKSEKTKNPINYLV